MTASNRTLTDVCRAELLTTKWLLAPSHRIGRQWIDTLVRSGQSIVNLHPTTLLRAAIELISDDLAAEQRTLASGAIGALLVEAAWSHLPAEGYLGRLAPSGNLCAAGFAAISALRMANLTSEQLNASNLESAEKATDLTTLLRVYETQLQTHQLVDEAEVYRRATDKLQANPQVLGSTLVLAVEGINATGWELRFLEALPADRLITIDPPQAPGATQPTSQNFFRAIGEANEVREVLRRVLAQGTVADDVEILTTDSSTYHPLLHAIAQRCSHEETLPEGLPLTFAEGLSTSLSRPGRALAQWMRWIESGYPQRFLVDMIAAGLFDLGDDTLSNRAIAKMLRPLAIGAGAERYKGPLEDRVRSLSKPYVLNDGVEEPAVKESREAQLKTARVLKNFVKRLLALSAEVVGGDSVAALEAAGKLLTKEARSANEFDRYAAEALVEQIEHRRIWLDQLQLTPAVITWLAELSDRTRIMGSGPRPGCMHVASVGSGGHSGRQTTFVLGLDDRRFPGAALQDPLLLDGERARLSKDLATSGTRLQQRVDELQSLLNRATGSVTLSWSCHEVSDDREVFPSSAVLQAYRRATDQPQADLETLNAAVGPPASFAPSESAKAITTAEHWLWKLSDPALQGSEHSEIVRRHYPHLAKGQDAARHRADGFGSFNGFVPAAGEDLGLFESEGRVLSASGLELAGRCPLAFFFRFGLSLWPPDELEIDPDQWLNPAQFGQLMHEVFRRFMEQLTAAGKTPEFERDHQMLANLLLEAATAWRKTVPPPNENAYRMDYWRLVRTSKIFLLDEEQFCKNSKPQYFEVALGLPQGEEPAGPLGREEPVAIDLPGGKSLRVRGQVDRVDEAADGVFSIWDYKIASGYGVKKENPFVGGRKLQSVLYLKMMEQVLQQQVDPKATVQQFGYFFPSVKAHGMRIDWSAAELASGLTLLERIANTLHAGVFAATDMADDCKFCDYARVCRDTTAVTGQSQAMLDRNDLIDLAPYKKLRR